MKQTQRNVIHRSHWDNNLVEVIDTGDERALYFAGNVLQSAMSISSPARLVLSYTRFMMATLLFNDSPQRVLVVGIGAGSLLRFLQHHFTDCLIDAIDCSSHIIDIARGYFKLPGPPHATIHCRDGYQFLAHLSQEAEYDLILIDAFDARGMSASIYRADFFALCRDHLQPGGIISLNLWSGDKTRMEAVKEDIKDNFSSTLTLPVPNRGNVVCLGRNDPHGWPLPVQQKDKIDALSRRFAINFQTVLKVCMKNNFSLRKRLSRFFS